MADQSGEREGAAGAAPPGGSESGGSIAGGSALTAPGSLGLIGQIRGAWANPAYRFVMLFLPYLAAVSIGYPWVVKHYNYIIQAFIRGTTQVEYWLFAAFSENVTVNGKLINFDGFPVKIIDECTGIYEMLIFAAAVLAFPTSWGKKLAGLLLGCPLIYLFNVLRIATLILVGRFYPTAFDFMHLYFWQATMIVWIVLIWMLWILKVVRGEEDAAPAPA